MAGISINSIIDRTFVERFQGLAKSQGSTGNLSRALSGGNPVTISSGLRYGAQTYATAIQNLNSVVGVVNISKATLEDLLKITDKLIGLADKATRTSTDSQQRRSLDVRFHRLAEDFKDLVEKAKIGDREYLTKEGLTAIFTSVGLDPEQSDKIAGFFKDFLLPEDDDAFASEQTKAQRPIAIPPQAFRTPLSSQEYKLEKVTQSGVTNAEISTSSNAYSDTDTILNQNPSYVALFYQNSVGNITSFNSSELTANITLKAVNETTGEAVVESTQNFLGFNAGGYKQLFLVDSNGNVTHQYTNNASASLTYGDVDISSSDLKIVYSTVDGTTNALKLTSVGTLGENPSSSTQQTVETTVSASTIYSKAKISDNGSYIAYFKNSAGDKVIFKDTATLTSDAFLAAQTNNYAFGFADNNRLVISRYNGASYDMRPYTYNAAAYGSVIANTSNFSASGFDVLQTSDSTYGYVSFTNPTTRAISLYQESASGGTAYTTYTYGASDTISSLSLAYNSNGDVDVGILGALPSVNSDSATQLYRLKYNTAYVSGNSLSTSSTEFTDILDSNRRITSRPEAYRMLADLKAMRKQIVGNIENLDKGLELIQVNMDLVRATGLAMLQLSNQIPNESDATEVATTLRQLIRSNAGAALAQAENLEPIAVAALAFGSSQLNS